MVRIGNFLFHYRNGLFPLVYGLLFVKSPDLIPNYRFMALVGLIVALLGQFLRAVTIGLEYIIRGGKGRQVYAEKLVQGGIFAHCRNPLYVGNFLILLGVGLASNSVVFLSIGIPFFIFSYWAIIAAEENYLRGKFSEEFDQYCARTNRLIPNLSGLSATLQGMQFNWRRLISAEYGTTFIWVIASILVAFKNLWQHGDYSEESRMVWSLWACLLIVILAYGAARYSKKKGLLNTKRASI